MSFGSGAKRNSKPGIEKLQQLVFLDSIEPSDSVATTRKPRPKIMNALAKCKSLKLFLQAGGGTKENVSGEIMRPRLVDATFAKNAGQEITSKSGKQKSVSPFIDLYQIERRNNAPKNDQKGSSPKGNQQSSQRKISPKRQKISLTHMRSQKIIPSFYNPNSYNWRRETQKEKLDKCESKKAQESYLISEYYGDTDGKTEESTKIQRKLGKKQQKKVKYGIRQGVKASKQKQSVNRIRTKSMGLPRDNARGLSAKHIAQPRRPKDKLFDTISSNKNLLFTFGI